MSRYMYVAEECILDNLAQCKRCTVLQRAPSPLLDRQNMLIACKLNDSLNSVLTMVSNLIERPRSTAQRLTRRYRRRRRSIQIPQTRYQSPIRQSQVHHPTSSHTNSTSHVNNCTKSAGQRFWETSLARTQRRFALLLQAYKPSEPAFATVSSERGRTTLDLPRLGTPREEMAAVDTRRPSSRPGPPIGGPISGIIPRPSLAENVRTASQLSQASATSTSTTSTISGIGEEKPLASGNGVSLSITLAEPVLFLQGFDQSELGNQSTALLRGSFHLRVSKTAKIKTISLAFRGRAETDWPEG